MESMKEYCLRIVAEKQELGLIPKLNDEGQKRLEARIDRYIEKCWGALNDASLSDLDALRKFGGFLQALDRKDYKTSSRALKRYWRRRELAIRKGKGRRKGQRRQKRFR